jgi:hypothetical protein
MPRLPTIALALATASAAFAPTPVPADGNDFAGWPSSRSAGAGDERAQVDVNVRARNGGVIEGQVVAVDYRAGTMAVQTPNRGRVDVIVLPSTNIQDAKNKFHTIADIDRGAHVQVFTSQRGALFIAQIIHLR